MVAAGYMTQAEVDALPKARIDSRTRNTLPTGTYFADWALPLAREGMDASYSQQVLTTTLDSRLQALANRIVARAPIGGGPETHELGTSVNRLTDSLPGQITVADSGPLDFETTPGYTLRLTVGDGVNSSPPQTVTINVTDVGEWAVGPIGDTDAAPDSIAENAAPGAAVGITALADDPDLMGNRTGMSIFDGSDAKIRWLEGRSRYLGRRWSWYRSSRNRSWYRGSRCRSW